MLVAVCSEPHNVAEQHAYVVESARFHAVSGLKLVGYILRQDNMKQPLRSLLLFLNLSQIRNLAISKPFLLEPRSHTRSQKDRVEWLGDVILCAQFDAPDNALDLVKRRDHDHGHILEI